MDFCDYVARVVTMNVYWLLAASIVDSVQVVVQNE